MSRTAACGREPEGSGHPHVGKEVVLGPSCTPAHTSLTAAHISPCLTTHRGSAPDGRFLSSSPEWRSHRSALSSLSSLWLRSEDERLRLECVARYSELLYTWGAGEWLEWSGSRGGCSLQGGHLVTTPLGS